VEDYVHKPADRVTWTARALANRETLDVSAMSISDLIVALSATEDQLAEWRGSRSPTALADPSSDHHWVIRQQARIVRELRSRRQDAPGERRSSRAGARSAL
jgi:hypothetical protein